MTARPSNADGQSQERRSTKRTKVFLLGAILPKGAEQARAHILDISSSGARVHTDQEQSVGDRLTLTIDDFETAGAVEWVAGNRFGMKFATSVQANVGATPHSAPAAEIDPLLERSIATSG